MTTSSSKESMVKEVGGSLHRFGSTPEHIFRFEVPFLQPAGYSIKEYASMSSDLSAMMRFAGGFLVILGCTLFSVRWNTINGKLPGLAFIFCAANAACARYYGMDGGNFKMCDAEHRTPASP